jgi:hypothetical protein
MRDIEAQRKQISGLPKIKSAEAERTQIMKKKIPWKKLNKVMEILQFFSVLLYMEK